MELNNLDVFVERIENIAVMRVEGVINSLTSQKFLEEVKHAGRKGGLIIDMEEISLISSMGIEILKKVSDWSYTSGNRIVLLNLSQPVKQTLNMLGMLRIFSIAPNEEIAMKMVTKAK